MLVEKLNNNEYILQCDGCDELFIHRTGKIKFCEFCRICSSHYNTVFWKKIRLKILKRDKYSCKYCDGPADSVDHIKPINKGGTDDEDNLTSSCRSCNSKKSDNS